jgi:Fungal chitosanase of glycosyl hydrolase group 75
MNTPCPFLNQTLQFKGSPVEQAQCLLRRVKVGGNVDDPPAQLPQLLAEIVGKTVTFSSAQFQAYVTTKGISAGDIGGPLNKGVSATSSGKKARYFVIHDTSDEVNGNAFPPNINDASWPPNNFVNQPTRNAHVFINRLGQSTTGHDYSVGWRATKRERSLAGALKGLFLHHELIQPRIKGGFRFAAVGPTPGFTAAQIDRLAVCYLAASLRQGSFMIPAFHCVLDLGIADGHDDPQNFDLFQWAGSVERILNDVRAPVGPAAILVAAEAVPSGRASRRAAAAAKAAAAPVETGPEVETVRTDLSDGERKIKVQRIKGTTALFFKAKFAVDADGAARAYHPDNDPEALDLLKNATAGSKRYIQGKKKNGKVGKGPRPGFFVSETALSRGNAWDADAFVDAEFIPYIVLPSNFAAGVKTGNLCTVVNLVNLRSTGAIFADTNPHVGEASVRTALELRVNDPAMPVTELAKSGGDRKDRYLYIVYPGETLSAHTAVPHWPAEDIAARADELFAAWGGIDLVKKIFA